MIVGNFLPGALCSLKEHYDPHDLTKPIARETPLGIFCFGKIAPDSISESSKSESKMLVGTSCFMTLNKGKQSRGLAQGVVCIKNPYTNKELQVNALADSCSSDTFLSLSAANMLGIKGTPHPLRIQKGAEEEQTIAFTHRLIIANVQDKRAVEVTAFCTSQPAGTLVGHDWSSESKEWRHLAHLTVPPPVREGMIDLIIGCDIPGALRSEQDFRDPDNWRAPVARQTPLGLFCFTTIDRED